MVLLVVLFVFFFFFSLRKTYEGMRSIIGKYLLKYPDGLTSEKYVFVSHGMLYYFPAGSGSMGFSYW